MEFISQFQKGYLLIKFDLNLAYYLLGPYFNMDVAYLEIIREMDWLDIGCFFNHMFCIEAIHFDI